MATTTRRPPKKPVRIDTQTPFDDPAPGQQAAEPQPEAAHAPEPAPQPAPIKTPTFFETMKKVPKADWGPRANIYLYRVEPVIDRTRSGDNKYINSYAEPVNEDKIMADYGSGRYKLMLNFRKPGAETGDLIDSTYMDILNMKYPPKIPLGEWTDDPRNKKWAWAKEALGIPNGTPAAAPPSIDPLAAFGTFMDIQDRIEERVKPAQPANGTPAPVDPWSAAEKILNMRSDNPMVEILKEQMKSAAAATEAERDRAFKAQESARQREWDLQQKLLDARSSAPVAAPKTLMEQLTEFATLTDNPLVKKIMGSGGSTAEAVARGGRTSFLDFARETMQGPAGTYIGQGLGNFLTGITSYFHQPAQQPNPGIQQQQPPPVVINAQQPNGTMPPIEHPEQRITRIGAAITEPLIKKFMADGDGGDFAQSMFDVMPEDYVFMRSLGAENIVSRYKQFKQAWDVLRFKEAEFVTFIQDFCKWDPNEDEAPAGPGEGDDGINDLTGDEA